ncbi:uncharacterized protein [Typha angustifolia]|uniref:uncharacterized protein isoform X2 n=1 Tax=Typha angustifolia TaxID=59011 RepID=UPI003C30826A
MECATLLRSIRGSLAMTESLKPCLEKTVPAHVCNVASKAHTFCGASVVRLGRKESLLPYLRASQNSSALTSNAVNKKSEGLLEKQSMQKSTFPNGFEALLSEVCDETSVAEVKLKVGNFELHLKRDTGIPKASLPTNPIVSPTTAPPIPSEPMNEATPAAQTAVPSKSPAAATNSFINVSSAKASKLAELEASGSNAYVIVSSPTVGTFRRGRTLKGKKLPPSCKEGDLIKEGQTIGFLDQFGTELPVKSDKAGEVLKVLCKDGEAVGYGDPLVAVLPSFHGIE